MESITLIKIEWNRYHGSMFSLLEINDKALFQISFSIKSYLLVDLLWFTVIATGTAKD